MVVLESKLSEDRRDEGFAGERRDPTMEAAGPYSVKRRGGRDLVRLAPVFSPDGASALVACGRGVRVYSTTTGEHVRSLLAAEEEDDASSSSPIVAMAFAARDERTLYACDEAGEVRAWKWHAAVLASSARLKIDGAPRVLYFCPLTDGRAAVVAWTAGELVRMGAFELASGERTSALRAPKVRSAPEVRFAVGEYQGKTLVAVSDGKRTVHVLDAADANKKVSLSISSDCKITALAFNPSLESLAVGDTLGRAIVWRDLFSSTNPPREICHWHHLPLKALAFSWRGGVMFTGGFERVVVSWGTDFARRFLPRLPAPVEHIATCISHIAISTADNGIQIVDAGTFKVTVSIREAGGLGGARHPNVEKGPSLQYVKSAPGLLLPAGSGHLHLYSTTANTLSYTMDITNTNIVHPERNNLNPEQIEINEISVGCRGQWLVTWEGKEEQERIRWWEWVSNDWRLHTVAACPHRPHKFAGIHMASDTPITLTADQSFNMRIWRMLYKVPGYEEKSAWYTSSKFVGNGGNIGGVTLSGDGSVAAAWFGARLTLWDAQEGVQKASLAHPTLRPQGRLVQFGRDHHMHYLACTTDTRLAVWNTMTLRLVWLVKLDTTCLVADPFSNYVAVITKSNDVFVFKMSEPQPVTTMKECLPPQQGLITSAAFAPGDFGTTDFRLYLLREQQEIFLVEKQDSSSDAKQANLEKIGDAAKTIPSAFSARMAEKQVSLVTRQQSNLFVQPSTKAVMNQFLLSSSAHAVPKLSTMSGSLLFALASTIAPKDTKEEVIEIVDDTPVSNLDENIVNQVKLPSKKKLMKESMEWVSNLLTDD